MSISIRETMLKAANHIESNPSLYNFHVGISHCGSPCCMLGWMGIYSDAQPCDMWENPWIDWPDSHSDMAAEQQQMEEHFKHECERIYLYLERHVTPADRAFVRERFLMLSESKNTAQMPLGWGGERHSG